MTKRNKKEDAEMIWEALFLIIFIGLIVLFFKLPRRKRTEEEKTKDPKRDAYVSEEP